MNFPRIGGLKENPPFNEMRQDFVAFLKRDPYGPIDAGLEDIPELFEKLRIF